MKLKYQVCKETQELRATCARAWAAPSGSLLKEKLSNHCCVLSELLESASPPSTSRFGGICRPVWMHLAHTHHDVSPRSKGYGPVRWSQN